MMRGVRAMLLDRQPGTLREAEVPDPRPGAGQALLRVHACGVCRTDLHLLDGEVTA
ncbi:MAG: alcohol dehydrogenase, propanol-preferring, partial [Solirubrobacteraceae bacterium]|nr:alcohol dehydrogenase, propanol-preferring [Solirubrobacteraceae bacterium]